MENLYDFLNINLSSSIIENVWDRYRLEQKPRETGGLYKKVSTWVLWLCIMLWSNQDI